MSHTPWGGEQRGPLRWEWNKTQRAQHLQKAEARSCNLEVTSREGVRGTKSSVPEFSGFLFYLAGGLHQQTMTRPDYSEHLYQCSEAQSRDRVGVSGMVRGLGVEEG